MAVMDANQTSVDFLGDTAENLLWGFDVDLYSTPFLQPPHLDYDSSSQPELLSEVSSLSPLPSPATVSAIPPYLPPLFTDPSLNKTLFDRQAGYKGSELLLDAYSWQSGELSQPPYLDSPSPTLTGDNEPDNTIHLIYRPPTFSKHCSSRSSKRGSRCGYPNDGQRLKGRCSDCGRTFTDLKAHMLTKQAERPEKCPVRTCEYHTKGFARRYDRARHTLTHFRGTIVCGFCPETSSAERKSFDNVNSFKRHLAREHDIEKSCSGIRQRKRTKTAAKKARGEEEQSVSKQSDSQRGFQDAQDLYDHLDDCMLGAIQRGDVVLQT